MGLIGAGTFLSILKGYRSCWIDGRWGGHKTSLAIKIAMEFLEPGKDYRLVTNCKCVIADNMEQLNFIDQAGHLKAFVIIDEGGVDIESSKQVKAYMAYAAKMDIITMIPSGTEPPPEAKKLTCQVMYGFQQIGIPLVLYKWRLRWGEAKDEGKFIWWKPSEVYGLYSRQDPGEDAEVIMDWLVEKTGEYRELHGRTKKRISGVETTEADRMQDAARVFQQAAEYISIPTGRRNRR